jgi:hypothetical protein
MKFCLILINDEDAWRALPPEELEATIRRVGDWYQKTAQAGVIQYGARLDTKAKARTVRLGAPGARTEPAVSAGPSFTGAENVGGFIVVNVESEEAAVGLAASWPGGGAVEVRPLSE